jgi:hypothetical protein
VNEMKNQGTCLPHCSKTEMIFDDFVSERKHVEALASITGNGLKLQKIAASPGTNHVPHWKQVRML